jgi:YVTN family beta-propeller protein
VNPALPTQPQTAEIVQVSNPLIHYTMPDNDVAVINTSTLAVSQYYPHVGTINLGLAVQPTTGNIYVANTDARNLVRFACANPGCPTPNLTGHWVNNQITPINVTTNTVGTPIDLNPTIDYSILPNPAALAVALAQPTSVVFDPTGTNLYVAAFGTDRVAVLNTSTGAITARIEIGQTPGSTVNSAVKRGPRGLALNASAQVLYVFNRIFNTISIVNTANNTVVAEIPSGSVDPTPAVIRQGRGFLYDAKLSGNGTGACASCHIDSEIDMLAWNLGDPTGSMESVVNNGTTYQEHPMKGPMTTQSLRGLNGNFPYHWRGDKPNFAAFNEAFTSVMGGPQLTTAQMTAFTNFINTIVYPPNPNQNLDRTLPDSIPLPFLQGATGNPNVGQTYFENGVAGSTVCNSCHTFPGPGTNNIIDATNVGSGVPLVQPIKVPQLRNQFQRVGFMNASGAESIDGFGLIHDGSLTPLDLLGGVAHKASLQEQVDIFAFQICFDTGIALSVGFSVTLTSSTVSGSEKQNRVEHS